MKLKFLPTAFLILTVFSVFSQKDKPTEANIAIAKSLKDKYEDEEVVIASNTVEINFFRNKATNKVEVEEKKTIEFMAIAQRADFQYSTGYDDQSTIESLELFDRKGKKKFWSYQDEAYSSESIFHNDYRIRYGIINLPLQGYTRTLSEVKRYKDVKYFTSEYFKLPYRVLSGKLIVNIPSWLALSFREFHFENYSITKTESLDKGITRVTYNYKDISGIKQESLMPGSSFLHPHIVYLPKSFTTKSGEKINLFKDTKDLYNWYSSLVKSVEIDSENIHQKVAEIIENSTTEEDKIKAIYYWVQDNIKYIAFEDGIAGFKPDSPQNVFDKRYGDCKGMAILLKTMLIEAGFDARLVWIGTDNIAYDYSMPSLIVDNHMIAAVILNGETVFLDGTEKFNSFGKFATRIQGKQALIENGDDFILKKVPQAEPKFNTEAYYGEFSIQGEDLIGKIKRNLSGEEVKRFLYGFTGVKKDKREDVMFKVLADGNDNAKVYNVIGFDPSNRDKDISLEYNLTLNKTVSTFDDNMYLEIDPVKYLGDWKIPEDRENPFQFSMKRKEIKQIDLVLPENFTVKALPEALKIENDLLAIDASYTNSSGRISYNSSITLKQRLISKSNFKIWNSVIDQLKSFYDEQIVLVKK